MLNEYEFREYMETEEGKSFSKVKKNIIKKIKMVVSLLPKFNFQIGSCKLSYTFLWLEYNKKHICIWLI